MQGIKKVRKSTVELFHEVKQRAERRSKLTGPEFSTGLDRLDEYTDGIHKGDLWIVGGYTGRGKTSLGLQLATTLADANNFVFYNTLEMHPSELVFRMFCNSQTVDNMDLRKGNLSAIPNYTGKLEVFEKILCNWNMDVIQEGYTFKSLVEMIENDYKGQYPDFIFLDFIQMLDWEREQNENVALTKYIRKLKELAVTKNIGIVVLSQFRRKPSGSANKSFGLEDLRGSGGLEQAADVVLIIQHTEEVDKVGQTIVSDRIQIAKSRHGISGVDFGVDFQGQYNKFVGI